MMYIWEFFQERKTQRSSRHLNFNYCNYRDIACPVDLLTANWYTGIKENYGEFVEEFTADDKRWARFKTGEVNPTATTLMSEALNRAAEIKIPPIDFDLPWSATSDEIWGQPNVPGDVQGIEETSSEQSVSEEELFLDEEDH